VAFGVEWHAVSSDRLRPVGFFLRRVACGVEWPAASSGLRRRVTDFVRRVSFCVEWPAVSVYLRRRVSDCCLVAGGVEWQVSLIGRFRRSAGFVDWPAASSGLLRHQPTFSVELLFASSGLLR
jgi:hypothetical protein